MEGLEKLVFEINELKNSEVGGSVRSRMVEFSETGKTQDDTIFKELCFCVLTANYSSEGGMRVQREIGNGFLELEEIELAKRLKEVRYRFPNLRAKYIVKNRSLKKEIQNKIKNEKDTKKLREFLVESVYGFGMKEASHFLRNIGIFDFAVLDFHVIDVLFDYGIIRKPKTLSKKNYLRIERKLENIAKKCNITQGELDFYLWYKETGKILK